MKLQCDRLLSSFAFEFHLRWYMAVLEDCCTHLKLPTSLHGLLLPALTTGDLDLLPSLISWMFGRARQNIRRTAFKPGNKYSKHKGGWHWTQNPGGLADVLKGILSNVVDDAASTGTLCV